MKRSKNLKLLDALTRNRLTRAQLADLQRRMYNHTHVADCAVVIVSALELDLLLRMARKSLRKPAK
jgi:hypothetical protein